MKPRISYFQLIKGIRYFRHKPKNLNDKIEESLETQLVWKHIKEIYK